MKKLRFVLLIVCVLFSGASFSAPSMPDESNVASGPSYRLSEQEIASECEKKAVELFADFNGGWQQYPEEVDPVAVNVKYNISHEVMDSCYSDHYAGIMDLKPSEMGAFDRELFFGIALSYHAYVMKNAATEQDSVAIFLTASFNQLMIFAEMCKFPENSYRAMCMAPATEV